ncbi:MAG: aminopeptidase P family protein [Candidatus Omnitrophota bacterium]|jgi:Xaa-Pro aminopeptidase|nr:MAG: aminopeptidase P family protein [Candidatus Omnitrophota bacterium]
MNLQEIQQKLSASNLDGWLFCDHHHRDEIAYAILNLDPKKMTSRRWFYFIPASGSPTKIVHNIESARLDSLPGETIHYSSWRDLHKFLNTVIHDKTIAMQYSPDNNIPMISLIDGGTIDLIRSFGAAIVSSADFVQYFLARLDRESIDLHIQAGELVQKIKDEAFELVSTSLKEKKYKTEYEIQQFILRRFAEESLTCGEHAPIVAVNEHAADPHFEVNADHPCFIKENDRLLIDLWAKLDQPKGVYYDITWCAYAGNHPPEEYKQLFAIVVQARKLAKQLITDRFRTNEPIFGYEVDEAVRHYITKHGYGDYFTHRTGHSIGGEVHGIGANIDNLETKDERRLIPGLCFSIEPGIYKPPIGVRTEIDLYIDYDGAVCSQGPEQEVLLLLL